MASFRDFLLSFRLQNFAVAFPIELLLLTTVMWLVVNYFEEHPEKIPVWRCALCATLLDGVSILAIYMLRMPFPMIFFAAGFVWLVGSLIVIRSVFQLKEGGYGTLFLYLLLLAGIHSLVRYAMG